MGLLGRRAQSNATVLADPAAAIKVPCSMTWALITQLCLIFKLFWLWQWNKTSWYNCQVPEIHLVSTLLAHTPKFLFHGFSTSLAMSWAILAYWICRKLRLLPSFPTKKTPKVSHPFSKTLLSFTKIRNVLDWPKGKQESQLESMCCKEQKAIQN